MNVLLLNTYRHGGAGIAAERLCQALVRHGVEANLLDSTEAGKRWPFYAERLSFLPYEKDKSLRFSFSLANFGNDIRRHPLVVAADILHLHWINQGFLSLNNIRQLADLGKPIVWTLHDMWGFTGGCHYSRGCTRYEQSCGNCPCLRWPGPRDLSNRIWRAKKRLLPASIQYVTCSRWLATIAQGSGLLHNAAVEAIPNPIDTELFKPGTRAAIAAFRQLHSIAPNGRVILFVAMKISEQRKGFHHLQNALHLVKKRMPDAPITVMVLGNAEEGIREALPYPVHLLGMIRDQAALAAAYAAADLFVIPSLEDNLPNTVMEAIACGTPVAGFRTGGIPEMAEHLQHGFIAPPGDEQQLADGIEYILQLPENEYAGMRSKARQKALNAYAEPVIAARYFDLYRQVSGLPRR